MSRVQEEKRLYIFLNDKKQKQNQTKRRINIERNVRKKTWSALVRWILTNFQFNLQKNIPK